MAAFTKKHPKPQEKINQINQSHDFLHQTERTQKQKNLNQELNHNELHKKEGK